MCILCILNVKYHRGDFEKFTLKMHILHSEPPSQVIAICFGFYGGQKIASLGDKKSLVCGIDRAGFPAVRPRFAPLFNTKKSPVGRLVACGRRTRRFFGFRRSNRVSEPLKVKPDKHIGKPGRFAWCSCRVFYVQGFL